MNTKKLLTTWIAVFLVGFGLNFVIHGVLLDADYSKLPNLLRTQEEALTYFPLVIIANVLYSLALAWIYAQGVTAKPWLGQGIRFGVAVWLLTSVPVYLTYYAVQPWPAAVIHKSILFDLVRVTLLGIVAAAIYRKE